MKTKTQAWLAWIFMLVLLGTMAFTLYGDYRREVREGRIMYDLYR